MSDTIKFDQPSRFDARGRNGLLACYGVEILDMGDGDFAEVHLHPLTSRGNLSEACRIPIRKSALPDLVNVLLRFVPRVEQMKLAACLIELTPAEKAVPVGVIEEK